MSEINLPKVVSKDGWQSARDELLAKEKAHMRESPLGRQEEWEDSPEGRPQGPPYGWWRLHDEYGDAKPPPSAVER